MSAALVRRLMGLLPPTLQAPLRRAYRAFVPVPAEPMMYRVHLFKELLAAAGRDAFRAKRILEINPHHELVAALAKRLAAKGNGEEIGEAAWLLLDQARILQGETLEDPLGFARRQSGMLCRALAG